MAFEQFNLSNEILSGLKDVNYTDPTELQSTVLPAALEDRNMMIHAHAGMGKHGAFIIPILEQIKRNGAGQSTLAVVLTPSPEGAQKLDEMFWAMGYHAEITSAAIKLGGDWEEQKKALADQPNVIVANPGRLVDLLRKEEFDLSNLQHLVVDELQEIQSIGILPMLQEIRDRLPAVKQTVLFTSKMNKALQGFADKLMGSYDFVDASGGNGQQDESDDESVETTTSESDQTQDAKTSEAKQPHNGRPAKKKRTEPKQKEASSSDTEPIDTDHIKQAFIKIPGRAKISTFMSYIEDGKTNRVCVFTASKRGSKRLSRILEKNGYTAAMVNDQSEEQEREERLSEFESGKFRFMLISDVGAAELPIKDVDQLINYDIPTEPEEYSDRLQLLKQEGDVEVVSMVSKQDQSDFDEITKKLGVKAKELPLPEDVQKKIQNRKKNQSKGKGGGNNNNRGKGSRPNNRKDKDKKGGKPDNKKSNNKNRGSGSSGKKKGRPPKKKFKPEESSELPRPNFDKLDHGKQRKEEGQEKSKEKKGVVGFFKKLFSS